MKKLRVSELNRLSIQDFKDADKLPYVVVLDSVRSLHNVGSVFRTADAFRCEHLYLCGITGTPPQREITKTAIGAERSVAWTYAANARELANSLKAQGYTLYAVEQTTGSQRLEDISWPGGKVAFVFGNEIDGVDQELIEICDACIEIPQAGTKHSLNISVAAGIVLWEYARQFLPHLA